MADDAADDRWTVRGVTKPVRDAAAEAAQRRKVTVGAWLSGAIDREINAERAPLDLTLPSADKSADRSDALAGADARLALVERAVASAVALANAPEVPTGFRRRANRLLRESLPDSPVRVAGGVPRLRIGVSAPDAKPNGKIEPGADPAFGHG